MKLAKLSLAALVAVGAFSVANATSLESAIKGVDLSGMLRLRFYNEDPGSKSTSPAYNRWRSSADFKFTIPVSDTVKFIYKLGVETNARSNGNALKGTGVTGGTVTENFAFLNYASNGLNVIAGRLPVQTTVTQAGHGENVGSGVIATYGVGNGITLAGAFIDDLEGGYGITGGADIAAAAIIYGSKMVDANAWYYRVTNIAKYVFTVGATIKPMAGVKLHADFGAGKLTDAVATTLYGNQPGTHNIFNVNASYSADGFSLLGGYAKTNKKPGVISLNADSPIDAILPVAQRYTMANRTDTAAFYAKVGFNAMANTNVYLAYANVNDKTTNNKDSDEYQAGVKYKYNKKLNFHVYYSILDYNSANNPLDNNEFRAEAKYSF